MTIEDAYAAGNPALDRDCRLVVISGCSGGGKSTLLDALARRGHDVVPEAGRQIVKEQLSIDGDALPWADQRKFVELLLSRSMYLYNAVRARSKVVFFDRSIVEPCTYFMRDGVETPPSIRFALERYRYFDTVFMTPPWRELYATDAERRGSFAAAEASYAELVESYSAVGYRISIVPRASVAERVAFVERELRAPAS